MKTHLKSLITLILVPTLLLIFGSIMFYHNLLDNGFGLFNLLNYGKSEDIYVPRNKELLKGDKVYGKIASNHPNLGIVAVRFFNDNRDSKDIITFRIKQESDVDWLYQANYNTDQFLPGALFPFGFPQIMESGGKKYIFELESLSGSTGSGILVDRTEPVFVAASFFDKSDLVSSKAKIVSFLGQKIINILSEQDNLTKAVVYFMPAVMYFLHIITTGSSFHLSVIFVIIPIICDIFYLQNSYSHLIYSVIGLWMLTSIRYRFSYQISAFFSLSFLILIPIFTMFGQTLYAEKSGVWSYLLMCVLGLKQVLSALHSQKNSLTIQKFFGHVSLVKINKENKTLKYTLVAAIGGVVYFVFHKLTASLVSVYNGYQQFYTFYPEVFNPPDKKEYTAYLLLILFVIVLLVYYSRQYLLRFKGLILLYLLVLSGLLNFTVSKFTNFKYQPKIFSISPSTTSESWVDITISGKNFQDLPFVGKVTLAGEVQVENVRFWSDEKIIFRTNPTTTKSGDVCVKTLSKGNTNCLPLEYRFNKK